MGFPVKRGLLAQTAGRYRKAGHAQKTLVLNAFIAAAGSARKYAIRQLSTLLAPPTPIKRPRAPRYGRPVPAALEVCFRAAYGICAKRLVPFLPSLVDALERQGHLVVVEEVCTELLAMRIATADRHLRAARDEDRPKGLSVTKPGALLKRQIPIRTFGDWDEARPGCMEADLVAHCGGSVEGAFLSTLSLTDVATGWTEWLQLLHRSQEAVLQALDHARTLLPFPFLGLDTDTGSEFLKAELLGYCEREQRVPTWWVMVGASPACGRRARTISASPSRSTHSMGTLSVILLGGGCFDIHGSVPTKGRVATQRYALFAKRVYQLLLLRRFERGQALRLGLTACLRAA